MTIFMIILAGYLLSMVAMYFITKFMFLNNHPNTLAPVWAWVAPGINTICAIVGFFLCWNYFPITGLEYWKTRWNADLVPKGLSETKEVEIVKFTPSKKKDKPEDYNDTYHGGLV